MIKENLTIGRKDFEVTLAELSQSDLKFYPENPRVYSVLNSAGAEPTQDQIEELMCKLDHVKQLKISIESNGGLIDPLIVRDGDFTVLEGNSRLAAYRLLSINNPVQWGKVKCKLLPANIGEDTVFTLLGQYHIIGRKDWEPFEQAHYLYRRNQKTRLPIEYMAKELGISKQKANNMINVIKFMIEKNDLNKRHWSYYEEYLKNSQLKKFRTLLNLDDTIAEKVKTGDIKEASDIRKLAEVAKVGDKQSKKLMQKVSDGEITLYEAHEEMQESGKLDDAVKKLNSFRKLISEASFEKQLTFSDDTMTQAQYEIKKILKRLDTIKNNLGSDNDYIIRKIQ